MTYQVKFSNIFLFFSLFIFSAANGQDSLSVAKDELQKQTLFEYLQIKDTIHITIETDLKTLVRKKDSENYQVAQMKLINKEGIEENWKIKLRARGNMRKQICWFPPLKVKFSKDDLKSKNLSGSNKLKLVTSCKNSNTFEQYVLREYVTYKMLNELTDESFNVQLVKFTFIDTKGKLKTVESFGFFIEDDDDVAERLGGKVIEPRIISPRGLEATALDRMSIFQYMIGNTDWYVYNSHNLKMFSTARTRRGLVVPYDFDYAGFVNAHYAVPHEEIPIDGVTERFYIGLCREDEVWQENLKIFRDKEETLLEMVETFPYFDNYSRKTSKRYLQEFFTILKNPKSTKRYLKENCDILIKRTK